jgi:hypothetical protein
MWQETKQVFVQSIERAAMAAARQLPGLVAMLLIVLVFAVLAFTVRFALSRILSSFGLDRRFHRWGPIAAEEWMPRGSPTLLFARVGFWAVMITGLLLGLGVFEPTSALAIRLLGYVPQALLAIVILAAGVALSRVLEQNVLVSAVNMGLQSARLLSLGVKWMVVILAAAMALEHLGIGGMLITLSFSILFGGIVLALALALGLGSRDAVSKSWEKRQQQREKASEEVRHL